MKIEGWTGVQFWLKRVSEEHNKKAIQLIKRSEDMFHEALHYKEFSEDTQKKVLKDLVEDMKMLGWDDTIEEYFKDFLK